MELSLKRFYSIDYRPLLSTTSVEVSAVVVAKLEEQLLLTLDPGFESRHQQILERINFLQNC